MPVNHRGIYTAPYRGRAAGLKRLSSAERSIHNSRVSYAGKLWTVYRLLPHDVALLLERQDRRCPCGVDLSSLGKWVHVDHCHETGRVRGLLCHRCNVNLGHFQGLVARWGWAKAQAWLG